MRPPVPGTSMFPNYASITIIHTGYISYYATGYFKKKYIDLAKPTSGAFDCNNLTIN